MPQAHAQPSRNGTEADVLTLTEAAAYLRVSESAVHRLAEQGALPGQRIDGEWRFLKRVVNDWLRFGPFLSRESPSIPLSWLFDLPMWEELIRSLEQRILSKLPESESRSPPPGSKRAVLRHFGIFKDDPDLEAQLADIRARRKAGQ